MDYDPSNIFAKILRGEIPNHTILETDDVLAFMDVMPQADGHSLVLPRKPSRNLLDADPSVFVPLMTAVQRIARVAKSVFKADGVLISQFNEPAAGQTIFHLHFHVIQRHECIPLNPHTGKMAEHAVLAEQAAKLREALKA